MTEILSERMDRVEQALRDLEGSNRQLAGLLTQAIKSGAVDVSASREPARKAPLLGAGASILNAMAPLDHTKTLPPWSEPKQGLGPRMQEHIERKAREDAELYGRPSPSS